MLVSIYIWGGVGWVVVLLVAGLEQAAVGRIWDSERHGGRCVGEYEPRGVGVGWRRGGDATGVQYKCRRASS